MAYSTVPVWAERLRRDKGTFSAQWGYVNFEDLNGAIDAMRGGAVVDAETSDGHAVKVWVESGQVKIAHIDEVECPQCCAQLSAA